MSRLHIGYDIIIEYVDGTSEEYKCITQEYGDNRFVMHFKDDRSIVVFSNGIKKIKFKDIYQHIDDEE